MNRLNVVPEWLYDDLAKLGRMTPAEVRALWDEYDGCNCPQGISAEAIHFHLNAIGEGSYCAV